MEFSNPNKTIFLVAKYEENKKKREREKEGKGILKLSVLMEKKIDVLNKLKHICRKVRF